MHMKKLMILGAGFLFASTALADSLFWTGNTGDGNWLNGNNWTNATQGLIGSPPGENDWAYLGESLYTFLTLGDDQRVGGLYFCATNNDYVVVLGPNVTLTVLGPLRVGTLADPGLAIQRTHSVAGGALVVTNPDASISIAQGQFSANGSKAILDLSGLDFFVVKARGLGIGSVHYEVPVAQRNAGTLYLAKTNLIALSSRLDRAVCMTNPVVTNSLEMVYVGAGNNAGTLSFLYLGLSNAFFVDSMGFGKSKASANSAAVMMFNPVFIGQSPVAYFRGADGDQSRITWWAIGDMADAGSSAQFAVGTNDFTGGYVDALVDVMSLGRDCLASQTGTGSGRINRGILQFDKGIIDVNVLILGNQSLGGSANATPNAGYVFMTNGSAVLRVNEELQLAYTKVDSTSARNTFGQIIVDGATLCLNQATIGQYSVSNAVICVLNGGKLYLTNTIASRSKPLGRLELADATLGIEIKNTEPKIWVTNLVTGGSVNTIEITTAATFDVYPVVIPLIKYVSIQGSGNNFVLGSTPPNLPDAYLTNNLDTSSIDLIIPTDPRPVITTQPSSFAGPVGSTVQLSVTAVGVGQLSYQWYKDDIPLLDGGNISGATSATLTIVNAGFEDSGIYKVVISNSYGTAVSVPVSVTISTGYVPPTITGLSDQVVLQGQTATFTVSVAGVPTPWIQWYKNGLPIAGANSTTLVIYNCQYPDDEAVYSVVATNLAGVISNYATLTVIVPPTIISQPSSVTLPVGSTLVLAVGVNAHPAPAYQWYKGADPIPNATNSSLVIANVQPGHAGVYKVKIWNGGGTVWSDDAAVVVTSVSVSWTNLAPSGTGNVCLDTLLRVKFNSDQVTLGAGTLRIYDSTGTLVETIDLSQNAPNNAQLRTIGGGTYYAYPVIIRSNIAIIYPRSGVLTSNSTYYVLMDTGFFKDMQGASIVGVTDPNTWRFTTKVALPDPFTTTNITVAADGSGDFATIQGAIDWIPVGAGLPYTVLIKRGVYEEINRIPSGKNNITFIGEGWRETVITYANNNSFQLQNASTSTRVMFYIGGNDIVFKNITFTNSTPQGGSQAEAVRVQGSRILFDNCNLCSYQDTILINTAAASAGYFNKCLIQGDVDFIWGSGIGYFKDCEVRAMRRPNNASGVYTQARTDSSTYGFIFVDCWVTASAPGMTNWSLGRDAGNSYPYGNVAWINCRMDSHISAAGWTDGGLTDKTTLRFWEYKSTDLTGTILIPTDQRVWWSRQLTDAEAEFLRDPVNVFAPVNWTPALPAYIATRPVEQTVYAGQTLVLKAAVGGVPTPACQWYKDGMPIVGATNETLIIPSTRLSDAGVYSIAVSNPYGNETSQGATITVLPPSPPVIGAITLLSDKTLRFTVNGTPGIPYRVWASTNLALQPITEKWTLIQNGVFTSDSVEVIDPAASTLPRRFYIITTP